MEEEEDEKFERLGDTLKGKAAKVAAEDLEGWAQAILVEYRTSGFKHMHKLNSLLRETELESERLSKVLRTLDGTAENG